MHPVSGLFAWIARLFGMTPIDWFTDAPMLAVILIVSWEWLPFGDTHPAHGAAIPGRGAKRSGRDGRRKRAFEVYLSQPCRTSRGRSRW